MPGGKLANAVIWADAACELGITGLKTGIAVEVTAVYR
jgi:hypothetical protein